MILETILTQNNSADLNNFENSHLSIQLSLNGVVYCIYDKDAVDIVFLKEFEFKSRAQTQDQLLESVKEIFEKDEVLSNKFESISITHKNNLATIVPIALYDKNFKQDYLKYSIKVLENDFITEDTIVENDTKSIYIPFQDVNDYLTEKFGNIDYSHTSSVLISNLFKYHKHNPHRQFFVNVSKNALEIVYLYNNKLQLYNSFLFYSKEDFLYYILFAMEQLQLNPDEQTVTFIGAIEKNDQLYDICYTYIRNIDFLKVNNFSLSESFYQNNPQIKEHQYFELLNQF